MALVAATKEFLARVEKPLERLIDLSLNQPTLNATLKITLDVEMFTKWAGTANESMTCRALADLCGIEESLMRTAAAKSTRVTQSP